VGGTAPSRHHREGQRQVPTRAYNPGDYDYFGDWGSPEPREGPGSSAEKQEELIHIFTQDFEVVTIGPQRAQLLGGADLDASVAEDQLQDMERPLPTVEEQGLCIGATFGIKAFNAVDPTRQINVLGFCRCVHTLGWHVNKAVLTKGGVVTMKDHRVSVDMLEEKLVMSIQVPYLFGVPQEWDFISEAISTGGGLIDRVSKKWMLI